MNIVYARLLATTFLITVATSQQLGFTNFPLNLTLPLDKPHTLSWEGQDGYVNITFSQFYYFGGGSEFREVVTSRFSSLRSLQTGELRLLKALNTGSSLLWTPDASLQQGIYGFFIATPNQNTSESPFFSLIRPAERPSGLSETAKVGLGVGLPLGLIIIACFTFIFWRERSSRSRRDAATRLALGQQSMKMRGQERAELDAKRPVYELREEGS